jgi:adenylate kinase family enzyme
VDFLSRVLQTGALLGDEHFAIAERILRTFIAAQGDANALLVLNGLPRHAGQAEDVERIVTVGGVIHLACSERVALERIRRNTGGDRIARVDDDTAAVRQRLAAYAERTHALLEHYERRGVRIETVEVGEDTTAEDMWAYLSRRT